MSRILYTAVYYLLTPLLFLRVIIKHFKSNAYKNERQSLRLKERLGLFSIHAFGNNTRAVNRPVWIHTVSVGEFIAALPLINRIHQDFPHLPLVLTCTTTTGSAQIHRLFAQQIKSGLFVHVYLPYDLPGSVRRFMHKIKPRVGIIMETEIWPNLFAVAQRKAVPLYLLNARMSARSARGYQRFSSLTAQTLRCLSGIAAQDAVDAKRLLKLGAVSETMRICGSIKFDIKVPQQVLEKGKQLRQQLGWEANKVLIAASTHQGEEAILLDIYMHLRIRHPALVMLIVPRHPERFQQVFRLLQDSVQHVLKRTQMDERSGNKADIMLGDTMGEMMTYFACADVVFMGGTLMPTGGHNILEPAALGLPVVYGPYMFNFQAISELFVHNEAALQVQDREALQLVLHHLLDDNEHCRIMGEHASQLIEQNRGAVDKMFAMIEPCLYRE